VRNPIPVLHVCVVGGGVEVGHGPEINGPAIGLDRFRYETGKSPVERVGSQGSGEDQKADRLAVLRGAQIRASHLIEPRLWDQRHRRTACHVEATTLQE
jgi:hypothetical protein